MWCFGFGIVVRHKHHNDVFGGVEICHEGNISRLDPIAKDEFIKPSITGTADQVVFTGIGVRSAQGPIGEQCIAVLVATRKRVVAGAAVKIIKAAFDDVVISAAIKILAVPFRTTVSSPSVATGGPSGSIASSGDVSSVRHLCHLRQVPQDPMQPKAREEFP
ncbi:hypothetical protein OAN307_c22030 [Octadecabacter antarcticus 307]|uniref:Uncharacterized protein n=1 Tax=Octadecabacter antarcticus 307 TaxID=391626 RepID=M9RDC6_9RHOB|nr:hypothetical protein OAN307_c22030 [Octadecabacter antarcticus 307]